MRTRNLALAAVMALVVAASALAASATTKDPSKLILQKKDFPAHADYAASSPDDLDVSHALKAKGVDARTAGYYGGTYSAKKGHLQIHGVVITTPSASTARQAFGVAVKDLRAMWRATHAVYKQTGGVPPYGDRQTAFSKRATVLSSTGSIAVFVQKRSVVWVLWALLDRDSPPKMSQVLTGLERYAAKQKARVGSG
jgi:hypothetical protein